MTDLISRADAMGAVQDHFNADGFKGYDDGQKMMDRIKALPSADAEKKKAELKENGDWDCPDVDCDECDHHRSVEWCSLAIPNHEKEIDETYKMVNEAFFEGFDAAEKRYRFLIETVEELDKKLADAVHGEWERLIEYVPESNESLINFDGYQCSVCGGKLWVDGFNFWNYCPNCGARMKGGDAEMDNCQAQAPQNYMQQSRHDDGRMTREEAITELTVHFEHWKRLKKEHIASVEESDRTIEALHMAIEALNNSIQMSNIQELEAENGALKEMIKFYREQQTIEVVRCKDCIHWQKTNIETIDGEPTYDCPFCGEWADANGFCSFGERREP